MTAFVRNQPVPLKSLKFCNTSKLDTVTTVVEILKFLQSKHEEGVDIVDTLELYADLIENTVTNFNEQTAVKLNFLVEQIRLCTVKNPKNRRYSQALLGMACMWNSSSSSLYKQILNEGVLTLPSIRTIHRLSSAIKVDTGFNESTLNYLKLRTANLNPFERKMSIILDEVYTSKACEFVNGQFRGIELGSDKPTKTILSIMINSLTSKFSEIVAMVPLVTLDSVIINLLKSKSILFVVSSMDIP